MTLEEQLEKVKKDGRSVKYINDPSLEVCLAAIKENDSAIQHIKNPTEEMCLEVVKNDGYSIAYIKNPTEEMCLIAVKQTGLAIDYINNPSEAVCLIAAKQDIVCRKQIEFSDKVQEYFVNNDINNIFLIPNNKLLVKFKKKYKHLLDMRRTGII